MTALRCPSCQTENPEDARRCSSCGGNVRRPRRRPATDEDSQGSSLGSQTAVTAFRCAAWGLIPGLGLVLGPVGVVLALLAYRREKDDPPRRGASPALAVLAFAGGVLVTNWVGVALMVYGLTSAAR
jgi:hypothetical protein